LIRAAKETNKLRSKSLEQWSTFQKVSEDKDQCQAMKGFSHNETNYTSYCSKVNTCIKKRMQWSDFQTIRDIIFVLGTQERQKLLDKDQNVSILTTEPSSSAIIDVDTQNKFIDCELEATDRRAI